MRVPTKRIWLFTGLLVLALAACDGDDQDQKKEAAPTSVSVGTAPALAVGPGLQAGSDTSLTGGTGLPGCSDTDSAECPVPLILDLDGEVSADGVTIRYATRYFTAVTGDPLIEIAPSENNKFPDKATFQVYFAESVDGALATLTDPQTADWTTANQLNGTIGVMKDPTQNPPLNTTVGAFSLDDGRVVVLKLITTGQYGWDLYSQLYEDMLNSLSVGG